MFMLFVMVMCSSALLVELEWNPQIDHCLEWWAEQGVPTDFVHAHRDGVEWSCDVVCDVSYNGSSSSSLSYGGVAGIGGGGGGGGGSGGGGGGGALPGSLPRPVDSADRALIDHWSLCETCRGYPDGHPECLGQRWIQQFPNVPTAMRLEPSTAFRLNLTQSHTISHGFDPWGRRAANLRRPSADLRRPSADLRRPSADPSAAFH